MTTPAETLEIIAEARRSVDRIGARSARGESGLGDTITVTRFDLLCVFAFGLAVGVGVALAVFAGGIALAEVWP